MNESLTFTDFAKIKVDVGMDLTEIPDSLLGLLCTDLDSGSIAARRAWEFRLPSGAGFKAWLGVDKASQSVASLTIKGSPAKVLGQGSNVFGVRMEPAQASFAMGLLAVAHLEEMRTIEAKITRKLLQSLIDGNWEIEELDLTRNVAFDFSGNAFPKLKERVITSLGGKKWTKQARGKGGSLTIGTSRNHRLVLYDKASQAKKLVPTPFVRVELKLSHTTLRDTRAHFGNLKPPQKWLSGGVTGDQAFTRWLRRSYGATDGQLCGLDLEGQALAPPPLSQQVEEELLAVLERHGLSMPSWAWGKPVIPSGQKAPEHSLRYQMTWSKNQGPSRAS